MFYYMFHYSSSKAVGLVGVGAVGNGSSDSTQTPPDESCHTLSRDLVLCNLNWHKLISQMWQSNGMIRPLFQYASGDLTYKLSINSILHVGCF